MRLPIGMEQDFDHFILFAEAPVKPAVIYSGMEARAWVLRFWRPGYFAGSTLTRRALLMMTAREPTLWRMAAAMAVR